MYNHADENYVCPFCLLVGKVEDVHVHSAREDIIYQDVEVTAFLSAHQWPNNRGHVIIVPNEHFENIYDLPLHLATCIQGLAKAVALAMKIAYRCEGITIRQNNEPAGDQDLWHYHLHVFPRYRGDRFNSSQKELMDPLERAGYAQRLRSVLATGRPDHQL